jgi:glycosyltransferase involved in cell wall biosynthesis
MANGRPVLGTNLGGVPWLIGAGEPTPAGWVVDPTPAALADGLSRSPVEDLGAAARARYERRFAPPIATATLIRIYEDVAGAGPTL